VDLLYGGDLRSSLPVFFSFSLYFQSLTLHFVVLCFDRYSRKYFTFTSHKTKKTRLETWNKNKTGLIISCIIKVMTSLAKCCCQSTKLWRKWQIQSIPTILQTTETTLVLYYSEILRHAVIRWAPSCWKRERKIKNHEMPRSQRGVWLLGRHANDPAAFVKVIDLFSFFWKPSK
jgi:hypothetical protein